MRDDTAGGPCWQPRRRPFLAILACIPIGGHAAGTASALLSFDGTGLVTLLAIAVVVAVSLLFGAWRRARRLHRSIAVLAAELRDHDSSHERGLARPADDPQEVLALRECVDSAFARIHQAVSAQQRFLATASHELRTPLAAVRAQAQVGLKSESMDETRAVLVAVVHDLGRASRLIEQLLDLARIDAHMPDEPERVVSLSRVLDQVLRELDRLAQRKQISIEADVQSDAVNVRQFDLEVVVRNLLSNAIQYSPAGGRVSLASRDKDGGVLLTVDDGGPGIAADRMHDAFSPFERLGKDDGEGVGLGLSIVKRIIDFHGATIRLQRSPLGGLRVEVWFPR